MAKYYLQQKIVIFHLSLTDKYYPEGPNVKKIVRILHRTKKNIYPQGIIYFIHVCQLNFILVTLTKYVTCKQKVAGSDRIL
jgi:hypothetical protein